MGIIMNIAVKFNRVTRSAMIISATIFATLSLSSTALAGDGLYTVQINKTEVLRLPGPASAVVVGNPDIADVSIHAADTIFVVGKGYGETNLLILDKDGNTMMSSDIQVITPQSRNQVRIFNSANNRQTYNCGPSCNPSPTLGDSDDFVTNNSNEGNPLANLLAEAISGDGNNTAPAAPSALPPN